MNPGSWEDIAAHLVPVLQRRGSYPTHAEPGTLCARMFSAGDRLPDTHPGADHRR